MQKCCQKDECIVCVYVPVCLCVPIFPCQKLVCTINAFFVGCRCHARHFVPFRNCLSFIKQKPSCCPLMHMCIHKILYLCHLKCIQCCMSFTTDLVNIYSFFLTFDFCYFYCSASLTIVFFSCHDV